MPELETRQRPGLVIALVGAESTGKTQLAASLSLRLADLTGLRCGWVDEALRRWCDEHARTPRPDEQAGIAAAQASRIEAAALRFDLVLADTTPLMTAAYHWQVFGDSSLDDPALRWQRRHCALTLLTALDLRWQADGLQRDGPQVRVPVDARLRQLLVQGGLPFAVVSGSGERRLESAIDALAPLLRKRQPRAPGLLQRLQGRDAAAPLWQWACERCDQPDCEHAMRQQLQAIEAEVAAKRSLQGR